MSPTKCRCVDYIRVEGGQFGNIESCGEDRSMDYNTFPRSKTVFAMGACHTARVLVAR